MLLRLRHSILDGDILQDLILLHLDLCCFDYHFLLAWFPARCDPFRESLDFEHRFREKTPFLPIFVLWRCDEAYYICSRDRGQFYVPVDCPAWNGLETKLCVTCKDSPVLSYYSNWVFEGRFRHLIFTVTRSELTVGAAVHFLRVAADDVFGFFRADVRARPGKPLLVALRA